METFFPKYDKQPQGQRCSECHKPQGRHHNPGSENQQQREKLENATEKEDILNTKE